MENCEILLNQVKEINAKYTEIYKRTGQLFNIFEIMNVAEDERKVCRIIAEILDPRGHHFQDAAYLRLFVNMILKPKCGFPETYFDDFDYQNAAVQREVPVDGKLITDIYGFMDIVISSSSNQKFIPIEVKIYAGDQKNQCYRYYTHAQNRDANTKVCYLTLDGKKPSEESICSISDPSSHLQAKDYFCISFQEDIITWLNACLRESTTIRLAPIREVIIQLISVLHKITGTREDEPMTEIIELISKTSGNYINARNIERSMKTVKTKMLDKFVKALEKETDEIPFFKPFEKKINKNMDDEILQFYNTQAKYCSGFWYKIADIDAENELCFKVDIDITLAAGFCIENKTNGFVVADHNTKKKALANSFKSINPTLDKDSWLYYETFTRNGHALNFRSDDEIYYKLYDDTEFKITIAEYIESIKKLTSLYEISLIPAESNIEPTH